MRGNSERLTIAVYSFVNDELYNEFVRNLIPNTAELAFQRNEEFKCRNNSFASYFFYSNEVQRRNSSMSRDLQSTLNLDFFNYIYLVYDATVQESYLDLVNSLNEIKPEAVQAGGLKNAKKVVMVGVVPGSADSLQQDQLLSGFSNLEEFVREEGFFGHTHLRMTPGSAVIEATTDIILEKVRDKIREKARCGGVRVNRKLEEPVQPISSIQKLQELIGLENDETCKAALQAILDKLKSLLDVENAQDPERYLDEWLKGDYRKHLSTLRGKSYFNSVYNIVCAFCAWFNPWRNSLYYTVNEQQRGNKSLFWASSPMQVAEVAVNMVAKSLSNDWG